MQQDTRETSAQRDALDILQTEHRQIEALFEAFDRAQSEHEAGRILGVLLSSLSVHAQLEHAVFYPALRQAGPISDEAIVAAERDHAWLEECIAQLQEDGEQQRPCRARVDVLRQYVHRHVAMEEARLMPLARGAGLDLDSLGKALSSRRRRLLEYSLAPDLARASGLSPGSA